jgi:hypothetical protein
MQMIRGKNLKATVYDISEGFTPVNPLFLKGLDEETLKGLYREMQKVQTEVRSEKFPHGDMPAIRMRNMRLQRLHSAAMVVRTFAKTRKIILA